MQASRLMATANCVCKGAKAVQLSGDLNTCNAGCSGQSARPTVKQGLLASRGTTHNDIRVGNEWSGEIATVLNNVRWRHARGWTNNTQLAARTACARSFTPYPIQRTWPPTYLVRQDHDVHGLHGYALCNSRGAIVVVWHFLVHSLRGGTHIMCKGALAC